MRGISAALSLLLLSSLSVLLSPPPVGATMARITYEEAYSNIRNGDWYRASTNESGSLAWGESYVMISLASMYRTTRNALYLDRLAYHADGVLQHTDVARGVADYHGQSGVSWRDTHYSGGTPYCWAVHTGMIGYPIAEFIRLVRNDPSLANERAYDGMTFDAKATQYQALMAQAIAIHDDEWVELPAGLGTYRFENDATFLPGSIAGRNVPLNMNAAMGRLLLVMWQVTGKSTYRDKAQRLAYYFLNAKTTGVSSEYLWNYWGDSYSSPGEDISHAALTVEFACLCRDFGLVITDTHLAHLGATFMTQIYVDADTFSDHVGGGSSMNSASYKPATGRWVGIARARASVYQAVRDYYDRAFPAYAVTTGSTLCGWACLAEYEPTYSVPFFYHVDWADHGSYRQATAYGANILTVPQESGSAGVVPVTFASNKTVEVAQWDGGKYTTQAVWPSTSGEWATRLLAYEPSLWFPYYQGGALYQFKDAFVSGQGIKVREAAAPTLPTIVSTPREWALVGAPYQYDEDGVPEAVGGTHLWWTLRSPPHGARIDPRSGRLTWTPQDAGQFSFQIVASTEWGEDVQQIVVSTGVTGVWSPMPRVLALQIAENPCFGKSRMLATLPGAGQVTVDIMDLQGRTIRTLVSEMVPRGNHEWEWDGSDETGRMTKAGVYFVRLQMRGEAAGSRETVVRRITLLH